MRHPGSYRFRPWRALAGPLRLSAALLLFPGLSAAGTVDSKKGEAERVARGEYIFSVAGGCACHSAPRGTPYAGAREIPIPMAKIYSTNLTADKETGLGGWSDGQIRDAMVKGIRPNGERLLPVMPYEAYSGMAEEDLKDLVAYLRTLKPVRKETPALKSWVPFYRSAGTLVWSNFFGRVSSPAPKVPKAGVERGKYLVEHVALCGDCHTPRNLMGVPDRSLYLAGARNGPLGEEIPNITPDRETGLGQWSRTDIAEFLLTGTKPDLDNVQGLMEEVIQAGFKNMRREDALAIADYLQSISPVRNKIK